MAGDGDVVPVRYFRLNRRTLVTAEECEACLKEMEAETGHRPEPVKALPDFYSLPSEVRLSSMKSFVNAHIHGIDLASALAVQAMDVSPGMRVLDLCCAPGAKLCYIADLTLPTGSVVGVDVSESRICTARAICRKYKITNAVLVCGDGTSYDPESCRIVGQPAVLHMELHPHSNWEFPMTHRARTRKRRRLEQHLNRQPCDATKADGQPATSDGGPRNEQSKNDVYPRSGGCGKDDESDDGACVEGDFDRVLVDAECTHDASLRHLRAIEEVKWKRERGAAAKYGADRGTGLLSLQRRLIRRGYDLLRPGGMLVYSTCSTGVDQNEEIVCGLLSETRKSDHPAELREVETLIASCFGEHGVDGCSLPEGLTSALPEEAERAVLEVVIRGDGNGERKKQEVLESIRRCLLRFDARGGICDGLFLAAIGKPLKRSATPGT